MTEQERRDLGIDKDDPGENLFDEEIAEMFRRMQDEEVPEQDRKTEQCGFILEKIVERYGIIVVLTRLAGLLSERSLDCKHIEWLSNNFNVLVNRAAEHNQEKYEFPFGL